MMVGLAAAAAAFHARRQHLIFLVLFGLLAGVTALKSVDNTNTASRSNSVKNDSYSSSVVKIWPKAFTPDETRAIVKLMKQLPAEHDDRNDKSVKRTNFFEQAQGKELLEKGNGQYVWILQRIHGWYCDPDQNQHDDTSLEAFVAGIDFMLLHEFDASGFFDWHVDTKPGDGTGRTNNINVMLSDHRSGEYEGGALMVGTSVIPAEQGDLYSYPASFPHKVADITGGRRHTFIIAMKSSSFSNKIDNDKSNSHLQKLWEQAEENHKYLCSSNPLESKFHLLYGEFLTALGRPDAEVDAKYADMYASTPQADQYLANFVEQGKALQQAGRPDEAAGYLRMAEMIRTSPVAGHIAGEAIIAGAKAGHSTDDL